jgi:outer membrane lipoprotein-sorting protein
MMNRIVGLISVALVLSACTQKSAYEAAVENMEHVYCYKSLAGVQCYQEPSFRDEQRMVNYFGPAPRRYDRPKLAP